jgi:excinuclease UvrABC nuclease subunit
MSHYVGKINELLARPKYGFSDVSSRDVPQELGVYVIYDEKQEKIIYIGRTRNLRRRLLGDHKRGNVEGSQFRKALGQKLALETEDEITNYILENCSFQFRVIKEFEEMVRLEHFATAVLAPVLNVQLRQ